MSAPFRIAAIADEFSADLVSGETPFPDGYRMLPPGRIVHVHAKDCCREDQKLVLRRAVLSAP